MKELLDKYKEFKGNRRTVGLTKLGFWVLFFGIMFLLYFLPVGTRNNYTTVTDKEEKKDQIMQYAFKYSINDYEYHGTMYENVVELISDDASYYITQENILSDKEAAQFPDCPYLYMKDVDKLIAESEEESHTSYKDGKDEYKYTNQDKKMMIVYAQNPDETINVSITYDSNVIEIEYYDMGKAKISFDPDKYIYNISAHETDSNEVENEYQN